MPALQLADDLIPAIGYIRVSMAREEMISPELQRTAILQWAARTGHRIIDWVQDLDKTGRNFKRRIMGAIERVERGEAKVIAVWKYSRFGRNRAGIELNLARIENIGGQLISATEDVDANTATGWFQRDIIFSVATLESKRAGEQWKETHQWRRDHGLPAMGRPRFGYIWHQRKIYKPDGTVTIQDERYEPDSTVAKVVADLYRRYIAGESFRALALWLNDEGHRTVRGDLWTGKAVKRYLDSGFPAGYLRFHLATCPKLSFPHDCDQYELVKHPTLHHPQIISGATESAEEVWRAYQERRSFTRTAAPRARNAAYPLTSLVQCGRCSNGAKRKVDGRKHAVYTCMARNEKGPHACDGTSLADHAIMRVVKDFLADLVAEVEQQAERHTQAGVPRQRQPDGVARRTKELEDLLGKLERSIGRHMKAYAMLDDEEVGDELESAHLATLKDLRAEKAAASAELAKLREKRESGTEEAQMLAAVSVAIGLLEEWASLPAARINALLRRVVGRVVLLPDGGATVVPIWKV